MGTCQSEVRAAVDQRRKPLQSRAVPRIHQAPEEVCGGHREIATPASYRRDHGELGPVGPCLDGARVHVGSPAEEHRLPGQDEAERRSQAKHGSTGEAEG